MEVKGQGQILGSKVEFKGRGQRCPCQMFDRNDHIAFYIKSEGGGQRSRSNVGVKGPGQRSRSKVNVHVKWLPGNSQLSQEPSADFSGTERKREKEKEKEHGETIKGPFREGPNDICS